MRGLRWQLAALIVSMVIFGAVAVLRISNTLQPLPTETPVVTIAPSETTAPTLAPTNTPQPTQIPAVAITAIPTDGVITYKEALVGQVQRLNPLLANEVERDITALIFEGLTAINQYGEPEGLLAESWIVSRDGREYVFQLRQGVLWQDGMAFDADDVLFTLSMLGASDFPGLAEQRDFWQTVEIQKLGSHTIRFRLAQPLASFPTLLTVGILPEHAFTGIQAAQLVDHPFNLAPIGTGAYQLEALRSTDGQNIDAIDLRLAPNYRQQGYSVERVRFRLYPTFAAAAEALANGAVDGLAARSMQERPQLEDIADVRLYTQVAPSVGMLLYNWDEGDDYRFFADQRVRNALQLALNYQTPVENILLNQAIAADSPILPNSWAYESDLVQQDTDLARAQELINNANIRIPDEERSDAHLYEFSILIVDDPLISRLAQEIVAQWSQLNLAITIEAVDSATFEQRLADADFDVAIVELALGADPDVYAYWHSGQYPDGRNYGGTADDRISEQLERARRESNGMSRAVLYQQFQQTFISRSVAIPLYYPLFSYAVREGIDGIQLGFIAASENRWRTIADWQITNAN